MYQNGNLLLILCWIVFFFNYCTAISKDFLIFCGSDNDYFHGIITISITIWDNVSVCIVSRKGQI